jgi:hypothetical protein
LREKQHQKHKKTVGSNQGGSMATGPSARTESPNP